MPRHRGIMTRWRQRAAAQGHVHVGSHDLVPRTSSAEGSSDRLPKGPQLAILRLGGDSTQGGTQTAQRRRCQKALRCQILGSWLKERPEKRRPRRLLAPIDPLRHAAGICPESLVQSCLGSDTCESSGDRRMQSSWGNEARTCSRTRSRHRCALKARRRPRQRCAPHLAQVRPALRCTCHYFCLAK